MLVGQLMLGDVVRHKLPYTYTTPTRTPDSRLPTPNPRPPTFSALSTPQCLMRFFYHMFGADMGSLRLLRRSSVGGGDASETELWSREGEVGDFWERGLVDLGDVDQPFQVDCESNRIRDGSARRLRASDDDE